MAEPPPLRGPRDPDQRLRTWFAAELQRAHDDLATGSKQAPAALAVARRVQRAPAAVTGLVAVVVAVVAAGLVIGPQLGGSGPRPTVSGSTPAASSAPTARPIPTYPGGIPTSIDGQPVLVGAAVTAHIAAATDDTPFLIGGITYRIIVDCASPNADPGVPLVGDGCGSGLWLGQMYGMNLNADVNVVVRKGLGVDAGAAYVLRVHAHDRQAADCPMAWRQRCEQAVVVDAVAWVSASAPTAQPTYPGGMPAQIDGQPVLVGPVITARVDWVTDDGPFLVGGSVANIALACTVLKSPRPTPASPLLHGCGFRILDPMLPDPKVNAPVLVMPPSMTVGDGQPVVLRVHTHDQRAAGCPASQREECLDAIVVEAIVWFGPSPAGDLQPGGFTPDGIPTALRGLPVARISVATLARPVTAPGCCLVAGWAEGLDSQAPDRLQVADAADASRTWSIDLGPGFEADLHGPVVISLTSAIPLRGTLVWHGGS